MKFSMSWLKTYLKTDASLDEITFALTDLGLEVENVESPRETFDNFIVGKILETKKHPDADNLKVCLVDFGLNSQNIVCGAPNARSGIGVVIAQPGTYVGGIDTTIRKSKIRGVESFGMMCSESELKLSGEHDGIMELANVSAGENFVDWLDVNQPEKIDPIIEIAITPNRPDALGVYGIARDLAARGIGKLVKTDNFFLKGSFKSSINVEIDSEVQIKDCPLFAGCYIKGVRNKVSPDWLQRRLVSINLKPISGLVDLTNFLTFDRARPLHVFDADKLQGNISVRKAQSGEKIIALDGNEYSLDQSMTVIADEVGPQAIAGIIGGLHSSCTAETKNIFVESAFFDPITTSMAGRKLNIQTDSRYRFERGVDPTFTLEGLKLYIKLANQYFGGEYSEIVVAGNKVFKNRTYKFDPKMLERLVGMKETASNQVEILRKLGFLVEQEDKINLVTVPGWRPDVLGEADLIEEVARVASLSNLKSEPLPKMVTGISRPKMTQSNRRVAFLRRCIASFGFNECINYSFIDKESARCFGGGSDAVMLANSISSQMTHLRPSLLPGLISAAARNQARGISDVSLFEIGHNFYGGQPGEEELAATGLMIGNISEKSHYEKLRAVDVYDVKGFLEQALEQLGFPLKQLGVRRADYTFLHPGRSGAFTLGPKNEVAFFGELHPNIATIFGVKGSSVCFSINLEKLPLQKRKKILKPSLKLYDLQAVERDFAFVVDKDIAMSVITEAVFKSDVSVIEKVNVFDVFEGALANEQLGEDKKSIAISVRIQPRIKTFNEKDIEDISTKIITSVFELSGGYLRS